MAEKLPVYIIDDDEMQLSLVDRVMRKFHNMPVSAVNNGKDGLALLHRLADESEAAIILLDLNMPQVTGFDILKQVAADTKFENLYMVVLSTSDEPSDVAFVRNLGFTDYLVKPTRHEQLNAKLEEINQRYQAKLNQ